VPEGIDASDNPEAYIPSDRRRALAAGTEMRDRVEGAALFADISGFTPLTEALAQEFGPQRGAEELTANLNRVFHAIIAELDRFGGDVIYFSGDAITCWIDGDDGRRATAAGLAMQATIARVGEIMTPAGTHVQLAMKVAIAVGRARRFLVGDPDIQLIDVLAGRLIDELAAAEHLAEKGDVVLEQSACESLADLVELTATRVDEESGRRCGVVGRLLLDVDEAPVPPLDEPLDEGVVAEWLLPAVYERMRTGRGEFLAELRSAYPVFVRFGGIDYDTDEDAIDKLDEFVCRAQAIFDTYGGNLLQLTLGDKGAYLYAVFGSPLAHEDDAARAAAAALEVRDLEATTAATDIQIGLTQGRLRSGTYGHEMRRTFVCLGDAVNLSARLMSKAAPGEIYVSDEVKRATGEGFTWQQLEQIAVKGKAEPIVPHALTGYARRSQRLTRHRLPLFGRRKELEHLGLRLEAALSGAGSVVGISAEPGMGKSRLVAEFVRNVRRRGHLVAFGESQAFGRNTSYFVWREIWRTLFHLRDDELEAVQLARLEQELERIDPELMARLPLLEPVVELEIPDNDLTRGFDAKLRKASLEGLLVACLRSRAARQPLVLVLEDCHWLDELSRELLGTLARAAASLRVVIVLAYRPASDTGDGLGVETLPHFSEIRLTELGHDETALLIESKLEQISGGGGLPPEAFVRLVTQRAEGNPFYVEELVNYIAGQKIDLSDEAALKAIELPESLNSLVLSRIDKLSEEPRRTLKVASVIGRVFRAPILPDVYPELGDLATVEQQLERLRVADLVTPDVEADRSWLFRHVVAQEVAYESLPFAIREELHESTARVIEASEPAGGEQHLDLLAHHYWRSTNLEKKREYLVRAGEAAQAKYANAAAIDYFRRIVPLLEGSDRWDVTRRLGEVLEVAGDWPGAEAAYRDALGLADRAGDESAAAWTDTSLADLARKRGDYDEATKWLRAALDRFEELGDKVGMGRVLQISGTVAATRGDFATAREQLQASVEIRRALGDKGALGALLSNLGIMAEYDGDYERSRTLHEEGLAYRIEAGDKGAVAISLMNLGNVLLLQGHVDEARARQEESLQLRRETGDPWMIALGEYNLGMLTRAQGDFATTRRLLAAALRVFDEQGDKWSLAFMLEDVAVLAVLEGDPLVALRLAGAGAALRDETGAPRGQADQEELDAALAPARSELGENAEPAWELGRSEGLESAVDAMFAYLET